MPGQLGALAARVPNSSPGHVSLALWGGYGGGVVGEPSVIPTVAYALERSGGRSAAIADAGGRPRVGVRGRHRCTGSGQE